MFKNLSSAAYLFRFVEQRCVFKSSRRLETFVHLFVFRCKDLRAEIEAHQDILRSLRESGANIVLSLEKAEDKTDMEKRLDLINERWDVLNERSLDVRRRLETAQEQWERLTGQLEELLYWIETKNTNLLDQQTVGGDLERCRKQFTFCQQLQKDIEEKEPGVKEITQLAQSFLMQQDLRSSTTTAKFYSPFGGRDVEDDSSKKNFKIY